MKLVMAPKRAETAIPASTSCVAVTLFLMVAILRARTILSTAPKKAPTIVPYPPKNDR